MVLGPGPDFLIGHRSWTRWRHLLKPLWTRWGGWLFPTANIAQNVACFALTQASWWHQRVALLLPGGLGLYLKVCVVFLGLLDCDRLWFQCRLEKPGGGCHVDKLASAPKKMTCQHSKNTFSHPQSPPPWAWHSPCCGPSNEDSAGVRGAVTVL